MLIIPSVDSKNLEKCKNVLKILRGFVSVIAIKIDNPNINLTDLTKVLDKQPTEIELFLNVQNPHEMLTKIVNMHSDVNIGKVFFYTNDANQVEQDTTNVRIFGINPGLFLDEKNYEKISIVNKFEYAFIEIIRNSNYLAMYDKIKNNGFKGNLLLDFGTTTIPKEIITNPHIDGVYFDITHNPRIKDEISMYRRTANSIY